MTIGSTAAALALVGLLGGGPAAAAIVACTDARGVQVLTSDHDAAACAGVATAPARRAGVRPIAALASPAGFPRVDAATQRARDSDRVRILEDELAHERARLGDLEARPRPAASTASAQAWDDDVARARENVRAIQGELARAR